MISPQALHRLATGKTRVVISPEGEPIEVEGLPDDAPIPGLMVRPVTEAVKQVEGEMIVSYLNRETLWAAEGFVLDAEVVGAIGDDEYTAEGLIEAVTGAGFEWKVVLI